MKTKYIEIKPEDLLESYTLAVEPNNSEPITVSTLEKIWKEAKVIPYKFIPTGEITYVTPEVHFKMEEYKKKHNLDEQQKDKETSE